MECKFLWIFLWIIHWKLYNLLNKIFLLHLLWDPGVLLELLGDSFIYPGSPLIQCSQKICLRVGCNPRILGDVDPHAGVVILYKCILKIVVDASRIADIGDATLMSVVSLYLGWNLIQCPLISQTGVGQGAHLSESEAHIEHAWLNVKNVNTTLTASIQRQWLTWRLWQDVLL